MREKSGKCGPHGGACPFASEADAALRCASFLPECVERTAGMSREAAWADVRDKGAAIAAAGGVVIVSESPEEIEALVISDVVEGEYPVCDGGPYRVILSKRSWENGNAGGWVQGFLCDCEWGYYNSGAPGPRYRGRFCSHAYAAMLEADARARRDFMNDRRASMEYVAECGDCGNVDVVDPVEGVCESCGERRTFEAAMRALYANGDVPDIAPEVLDDIAEETVIEEREGGRVARWRGHQVVLAMNNVRYVVEYNSGRAPNYWVIRDKKEDRLLGGYNNEFEAKERADELEFMDTSHMPQCPYCGDYVEYDFCPGCGYRGPMKNASKVATRHFTTAEMRELEEEVAGKPWLTNADRLKDPMSVESRMARAASREVVATYEIPPLDQWDVRDSFSGPEYTYRDDFMRLSIRRNGGRWSCDAAVDGVQATPMFVGDGATSYDSAEEAYDAMCAYIESGVDYGATDNATDAIEFWSNNAG